jgi:hypothetical protein
MRQALKPHPDSPALPAIQIEAEVLQPRASQVVLRYVVTGSVGDILLPPIVASARGDELWRHTCFEAFVATAVGTAYYEFNFAPSTQWAAYRFEGYRTGMRLAQGIAAPDIETRSAAGSYTLQATLTVDRLPDLPPDAAWRVGLSALIEDTRGEMSYWALAHPPGKPDFHHADCFAYEFAPAVHS